MVKKYTGKRVGIAKTRRFANKIFKYKTSATSMLAIDKVKASLKKKGYQVRTVRYIDHTDIYYR